MDITAQSDDLEHQEELELSRAVETIPDSAVATTAAAADDLILVEDNRKDDVISLLETSQGIIYKMLGTQGWRGHWAL